MHDDCPPQRPIRHDALRVSLRLCGALALLASSTFVVPTAEAVRIATYNLLNYTSGRETHFRTTLGHMDVDVLFVQEILSQAAVDRFRTEVLEVLNPGEWASGPFVNGPDTDSCVFYRTTKVEHIGHYVIQTQLRDIDEYTFKPVGYEDPSTHIRGYVVHLKASQGSTEEQRRLAEVTAMRARMETFPPGQNYFVTGDFNIYRSTEPAYAYMLSTTGGTAGVVQDPIAAPGNWHDNSSFAWIHTQSPRTTQFGGGANGGLDDRFDMFLVSPSSLDGEGWDCLPSTYEAVGQDGLHFNKSILDAPPNEAVPPEVAQAIHDGSDHLPLMVEFQVPPLVETAPFLAIGPVFVGTPAQEFLPVSNRAVLPSDELDYSFVGTTGFGVPAGAYTAESEESPNLHPVTLDTSVPGLYADAIQILSDDPDDPQLFVPVTGVVLRHAEPSLASGDQVTEGTVDFGVHGPGPFPSQDAVAFNFGFDAVQGLLEVYEAEFAGDPRFGFTAAFDPRAVGEEPEAWGLGFDGTGASFGIYEATLTLRTRDQQDVPGAIDLSDLVLELTAIVDDAAEIADGAVAETRFRRIEPNPFGTTTDVLFSLAEFGPVRIAIYDAGGRALLTLVDGVLPAGEHRIGWDGKDRSGNALGAGIYFLRLHTAQGAETRHVVKVR